MGRRTVITPAALKGSGGAKRAQLKPTDYRVIAFGEAILEECIGIERLSEIKTKAVTAYQDMLNVHVEASIKDGKCRDKVRRLMKELIKDREVLASCKDYLKERRWEDYAESDEIKTTFRLAS